MDPEQPGHCTNACDGQCPDDYECRTVLIPGTSSEYTICVPAEDTLCNACMVNNECGDSRDNCIDLTGGRYCSLDCAADPNVSFWG